MTVLAIGAHPDDIELGCGGALLAHRRAGEAVWLLIMSSGTEGGPPAIRRHEQCVAARRLQAEVLWGGFRDGEIPNGKPAIQVVDDALALSGARIVYTHAHGDSHQDHRHVAQATLSAARNLTTILGYETPSTTRFAPNTFVSLVGLLEAKLELIGAHSSQIERASRVDLDVVAAQARVRGHQGRLAFAEAFEAERLQFLIGASVYQDPLASEDFHGEAAISQPRGDAKLLLDATSHHEGE